MASKWVPFSRIESKMIYVKRKTCLFVGWKVASYKFSSK